MTAKKKQSRKVSPPRVQGVKTGPSAAGLNPNPKLYIDGKAVGGTDIEQAILSVELERSIHQASTLTITTRDPGRVLEHAGYYEKPHCEAKLDGLDFLVCDLEKKVDEFTLKFEDREFAILAEDTAPVRKKHTGVSSNLQHFFKEVCAKVVPHAEFVCPELDAVLEKTGLEGKKTKKAKKTKANAMKSPRVGTKGITAGAVTVKGAKPDPDQINNLNTVLEVCESLNVPTNVRVAIICAGTVESTYHTHDPANDGTGSDGVFQLTDATAASNSVSKFDTKRCAELWLNVGFYSGPHGGGGGRKLGLKNLPPGVIAQEVEGSADPGRYEEWRHEAENTVQVFDGGATTSAAAKKKSSKTEQIEKATVYELNLGKAEEENTLQGLVAYAEAINWRFFPSHGKIYFLQDKSLAAAKPAFELDESSIGIISIDYEIDRKKKKKPPTVTIEARAHLWPPEIGETVKFKALSSSNPYGLPKVIAKGNWIIETIERKDITDNACTITCSRPEASKPEETQLETVKKPTPRVQVAPSPTNPSGTVQNPGGGRLASNSIAWQVYEQAKWISEQHFYYHEGGGHSGFHADLLSRLGAGLGEVSPISSEGLDCSGAASWALHTAGAWPGPRPPLVSPPGPMVTQELESYGEAGEGKYVTLWVIDSGLHHVFLWIRIPSNMRPEGGPAVDYAFEASHTGAVHPAPHGVGLRPRTEYYANPAKEGFKARRWPGT